MKMHLFSSIDILKTDPTTLLTEWKEKIGEKYDCEVFYFFFMLEKRTLQLE